MIIIKSVVAVIFFTSLVLNQTTSCNNRSDDVEKIFNVDEKVELVFFYDMDSSYQERKYFHENVLMKPMNGGYWTRDGVQAVFGIDRNGYEGIGLKFTNDATKEQREDIKRRLKESPIVYKIYENVVPNKIDDLEESKHVRP